MTKIHNRNLDILRTFAAIAVVVEHVFTDPILLYNYKPVIKTINSIGSNIPLPAHMSVLIFFILSGYVIGVNHPVLSNKRMITDYIKKRLIRILPIYFTAILFTSVITYSNYNWATILENLFMISVPLNHVMGADFPLWSLNYEMIFYFLFILFAYFNADLLKTLRVLLLGILALFIFSHNKKIPPLLISYFIGFIFWIAGAMIAQFKTWEKWHISHSRIISIFMLICCTAYFNPYGPILKVLKITVADYSTYSWFMQAISYADLFYLPLGILLITSLTRSYKKMNNFMLYFIFIACFFRLFMIYKVHGFSFIEKYHFITPSIILSISLLLWFLNFQFGAIVIKIVKSPASLANISYALYMIHVPLIFLFRQIIPTSLFYFIITILSYIFTLFFVSYLLESVYQPYIKKLFYGKKQKPVLMAGNNTN